MHGDHNSGLTAWAILPMEVVGLALHEDGWCELKLLCDNSPVAIRPAQVEVVGLAEHEDGWCELKLRAHSRHAQMRQVSSG